MARHGIYRWNRYLRIRRMKPQTPKSKLQGNSKLQPPKGGRAARREKANGSYPPPSADSSALKETPSNNGPPRHPFDLMDRTAKFGEAIIRFTKKIPRGPRNDRLIDQLVGCGTSIGANYCEANESASRRDFTHSISRCAKEASETKFFLRMVAASEPQLANEARGLYGEGNELHLIFANIFRKGRGYSK